MPPVVKAPNSDEARDAAALAEKSDLIGGRVPLADKRSAFRLETVAGMKSERAKLASQIEMMGFALDEMDAEIARRDADLAALDAVKVEGQWYAKG